MKRNKNIKLIGRRILELRAMSFYINYTQICEVISLFVKTDDGKWYKIISSEGSSYIDILLEEPKLISIDSVKDEFAYPVFVIKKSQFLGRITDVKQYLIESKNDVSVGFYFAIENAEGFSVIDDDDCLFLHEGLSSKSDFELIDF